MRPVSIGEMAEELGVAVATLRRWHRQGRLLPAFRTPGGHRRYGCEDVRASLGLARPPAGKTVCYARVSSHDPATQLQTQAARLEKHCLEADFSDGEVVMDLGSGLNYRKRGLQGLVHDILRGRVARLVLVTKDRLLRFGSELLFRICAFFSVEVVILDADAAISREQQLTEDLVEILTVFSSRLYRSRSRKNQKALAI
ncbi:IS607 family transposase [Trinickia mobilis]|uniref:IS607 family transposase n=1 Tax=Trinickia mobilis TaxID=2816356 RepID=UPI001A8D3A4E|nr:IS607 family transposase [Trinickia mobilis]